ncbi:MAG: MarR family transcriptional regulator [Variovorax sp.]|nr:MAG: MarR family transcriptional regulator [Variovorax sp.]
MRKKLTAPPLNDELNEPGADQLDVLGELACTNTALRRAARRLGQIYDEALAPLGLKATQAALISEISKLTDHESGEGPTLQDLAARLAIQISALTHAMRPLVRDGLVVLRQDDSDGRTKHGVLTLLGRERLKEALLLWAAANRRVENVLGPASAVALRHLADQVASEEFLFNYRKAVAVRPGAVGRRNADATKL